MPLATRSRGLLAVLWRVVIIGGIAEICKRVQILWVFANLVCLLLNNARSFGTLFSRLLHSRWRGARWSRLTKTWLTRWRGSWAHRNRTRRSRLRWTGMRKGRPFRNRRRWSFPVDLWWSWSCFVPSTRSLLRTITLSVSTNFPLLLFLMVTNHVWQWSTWSSRGRCGSPLGTGNITSNIAIVVFLPEAF